MIDELGDRKIRAYYDAAQFRDDAWNQLQRATWTLAHGTDRDHDHDDELVAEIGEILDALGAIEAYFAFPGRRACDDLRARLVERDDASLAALTERIVYRLTTDAYRRPDAGDAAHLHDRSGADPAAEHADRRPYFEVLVVGALGLEAKESVRSSLLAMRRPADAFIYDVVFAPTSEDAVIAALFNHNIQSCVLRYNFPVHSDVQLPELRDHLTAVDPDVMAELGHGDRSLSLARALRSARPELDLFLKTSEPIETISPGARGTFRRVFYRQQDYLELHLSILKGIHDRYDTPFFTALTEYSRRPTGVFHALPISRGKSITKSHWIRDMGDFYGPNIFQAETSATTGGLDSLLQPVGPLKDAQERMARAYGSDRSYLVTNGTSTANKIVMQALCRPGDIALVSHDCHKSHPYALVLSGAMPVYLDAYPRQRYSMYGGVPLAEIKRALFELKEAGKLDQVRLLLLTNCTFDGIVYNPEMVMREVLAIKPDMVFIWDEAWYAFARFTPTYRRRTGMDAARRLRETLASDEYRERYAEWRAEFDRLDPHDGATWTDHELLPDPDLARVRVYATQSTHKTLTSLRQGSVIHVADDDFARLTRNAFEEAYMTHTSTSPNYQILASLDVGRRQVELEGYELVSESVQLAMALRQQLESDPLLSKYFALLRIEDLIPPEYRGSGMTRYYDPDSGYQRMGDAWSDDEFVLEPQRITVHVGASGIEGDALRKLLIDRFDIQINKTSRNTLLFMLNIGTTRGSIAYLLQVLTELATEMEREASQRSPIELRQHAARVHALTEEMPPLPNFSRFHDRFRPDPSSPTPEGDMREAFYLSYDEELNCEHIRMDGSIQAAIQSGREVVSAAFVTPYPPGFPVLVPGQVISLEILRYLKALDVKEIHGYDPEFGLLVFRDEVLRPSAPPDEVAHEATATADRPDGVASGNGGNGVHALAPTPTERDAR